MVKKEERICRVLLAEDHPGDSQAFEQAAQRSDCQFELQVVIDGQAALDFLRKRGEWADAWTPDFVVLNINMPKYSGWDVLREMKADPQLRLLPVAMWSIAAPECGDYAERVFTMGACGGFSKPVDPDRLEAQVRAMLEFYWWAWSHPLAQAMGVLSCGQ